MKRRLMAAVLLLACFSTLALGQVGVMDGKMWVGIGYLCARSDRGSAEAGLILGTTGALHSTLWGIAAGTLVCTPAGWAAGFAVAV